MNRGLKVSVINAMSIFNRPVTFTSPMNRGLKDLSLRKLIFPLRVTFTSPMNRGLKAVHSGGDSKATDSLHLLPR